MEAVLKPLRILQLRGDEGCTAHKCHVTLCAGGGEARAPLAHRCAKSLRL